VIFMLAFGSMFDGGSTRGAPRAIAIWHAPADARGVAPAPAVAETPGLAERPAASADAVPAAIALYALEAGFVVAADPAIPVELVLDLGRPPQVRAPLEGALTAVAQRALAPAATRVPVEVRSPPGLARPLAGISSFQLAVPGNAVLFG